MATLITYKTPGGKHGPIQFTHQDEQRITALARWKNLDIDRFAQTETDPALWIKRPDEQRTPEEHKEFEKAKASIRRRMGKLGYIVGNKRFGLGPAVKHAGVGHGNITTWYPTRTATRLFNLPWQLDGTVNIPESDHTWFCADIGLTLEAHGLTVYSERELGYGVDQHGNEFGPRQFISEYTSTHENSLGVTHSQRPDLVIPGPDNKHHIVVEVERTKARNRRDYYNKLVAYGENPNVVAVWYICERASIAQRIVDAANKADNDGIIMPTLRIKHTPLSNNFHYFNYTENERMVEDITNLNRHQPTQAAPTWG